MFAFSGDLSLNVARVTCFLDVIFLAKSGAWPVVVLVFMKLGRGGMKSGGGFGLVGMGKL